MGRCLQNGILVKMTIWDKKYSFINIKKDKDKMLNSISNLLDLSLYDITEYDDAICLELKKEIFNDNIHSLFKEMNSLTECENIINMLYGEKNEINVEDDSFNKENNKIELKNMKLDEDDDSYHHIEDGELYVEGDNENIKLTRPFMSYQYCLNIKGGMDNDFNSSVYFFPIWGDFWSKYGGEDESYIIYLLNYYSRGHYKNILSKCLFYFTD